MDEHVILFILANEADELQNRHNLRAGNRMLRDASDPFHLPDRNFIKLFCLNREIAWNLCQTLSPHILCERVTAVPAVLKILTAAFFYAHGSYQKCVGSGFLFGLSQPSVSRAINIVSTVICNNLLNIWVKFPLTAELRQATRNRFYEKFHFQGIIGCIDCTHVAIVAPSADDVNFPGLVYINRKGYHSINVQIICNADLKITAINARYPGSVHDAAIWQTSSIHQHMLQKHEEGVRSCWLLGDSGYPLQPWLLTPVIGAAAETPEGRYTRAHATARNSVERCIGVLKMRFQCLLRHRTLHYNPETCGHIIYACAVLHNMALAGNVPEPEPIDEMENEVNGEEAAGNDNWYNEGRQIRANLIQNVFA